MKMWVLVDQKLVVEDLTSALNSLLAWHTYQPLLAVAAFDQEKGGIVNVYFDDGTLIASDLAPKVSIQVTTISWHPVRKLLAIGWENGNLTLWEETNHSTKEAQTKHSRALSVCCWSPNGTQLVSSDVVGSCTGWHLDAQGALSVLFHHELSTSISGIVFRTVYSSKLYGNEELDKSKLSVLLNEDESNNKISTQLKVSSSFFVGSLSGMVFYVSEVGNCQDVLQMDGAIRSILHYSLKDILIVVTEMMVLAQFKIGEDGSVTEQTKMKLSGKNSQLTVDWVGDDTLSVCSGESVLRLWNIENGQNCVLSLGQEFFESSEVITCTAYDSSKCLLVAGTSNGNVATWRLRQSISNEDWIPQPPVRVQGSVQAIGWGTNKHLLGVVTVTDRYILNEQKMCFAYNDDLAAVQIAARHVSITVLSKGETFDLNTDVQICHIFLGQDHIAVSDGKRLLFFIINFDFTYKFIGSFNTDSTKIIIKGQIAIVLEDHQVELKTFEGTLKQKITLSEEEGRPLKLNSCGEYLNICSSNNYISIWELGKKEAKLHAGPKSFSFILKDSIISSSKINCGGNKVTILLLKLCEGKDSENISPIVYFWDIESNRVNCFDIDKGKYGDIADKELSFLPQCKSFEILDLMRGRQPLSHFWDSQDPRLLVFTLKLGFSNFSGEKKTVDKRLRIKRSSSTQTFRWEHKSSVTVASIFVTSDHGLLIQDVFPLKEHQVDLLGLKIPYYYIQLLTAENLPEDMDADSKVTNSSSSLVKALTMRDFAGLENCTKETRDAVMDFSFYLTSNNMDEAFRAIKMIHNQSVWDNMAKMCVKTKRLDVASVCLGKMNNPRGAKALRESANISQLDARVGFLAVQLGMISEAESLFKSSCRFDLLNKLYQDTNQWAKAIEISEIHDRIHRRSTYYNYAAFLESKGEVTQAIPMYEKSENHHFEVPRMLFDEPRSLEAYILKSKDKDLFRWWAQYMESIGEMETALQFYEAAKDYLSLVRVYCYCSNLEKASEIANEYSDKAACFHLGRQYENQDNIQEAIHFFTRAQAYSNAIRICKEQSLNDQLFNLALMSGNYQMMDVARYYEELPHHQDKAVMLYQKAGCTTKAIELSFKNKEFGALHHIVTDFSSDTDPKLLQKCAKFFIENGQYEKAVYLLASAKLYLEALDICLEKNIQLSEDLVEKLTVPKDEGGNNLRNKVLNKIGEICMIQENYHMAAKKFTQSGDKIQAMKALLKSGDTEKIIFFAGVSRHKTIYLMAANYLQSLDWRQNSEIMKQIINFYSKGKAMDLLAGFYNACAQVEIDEYQNYEKALGAWNEALTCLSKSETTSEYKRLELEKKMSLVKRFVNVRHSFESSPEQSLGECRSLLDDNDIEIAIRRGDIYGYLVEQYAKEKKFKAAHKILEEMSTRIKGSSLTYYVSPEALKEIYEALNIEPSTQTYEYEKSEEEIPEDFAIGEN